MSPEQVEGHEIDHRNDLYSFGVTCNQMLVGRPPFQGDTALGVAVQHLKNEPRAISEMRPNAPTELCPIIHKLLAKSVNDRYQSAAELLRDLRTWRSNRPTKTGLAKLASGRRKNYWR